MTIHQFTDYIQSQNKRHIIFDFDETLCTIHADWQSWREEIDILLGQYDPQYQPFSSYGVGVAVNKLVALHGKVLRDKFIETNYRAEQKYCHGYEKNNSALECLAQAAEWGSVYLWTSNDSKTVAPILKEVGIDTLFTRVIANDDVFYMKPDPDGFTSININGLSADQFLMIGDSESDKEAAEGAGIDFIQVQSLQK